MRLHINGLITVCLIALVTSTFSQEIAGIGVVLGKDGDGFVIKAILPDSVAARNDAIRVGDRLLTVAQEDTEPVSVKGLPLDEVVRMIRGPKGAAVRLTILGPGQEEGLARAVSFVRGELKQLSRWGDGVPLREGVQAPNIQMVLLQGSGEEYLANHSNKVVVLEFWATWCNPCQKILADFQSFPDRHPNWKDRVVLIAASVDEKAEVASKQVKAKGWGRTHNVWIRQDAIKAYHVNRLPTTYIIDRKGTVIAADYRGEIPEIVNRLLQ